MDSHAFCIPKHTEKICHFFCVPPMIAGGIDCLHSPHFKLPGTNSFYLFKHSGMKSYLKYREKEEETLKFPKHSQAKIYVFKSDSSFFLFKIAPSYMAAALAHFGYCKCFKFSVEKVSHPPVL